MKRTKVYITWYANVYRHECRPGTKVYSTMKKIKIYEEIAWQCNKCGYIQMDVSKLHEFSPEPTQNKGEENDSKKCTS